MVSMAVGVVARHFRYQHPGHCLSPAKLRVLAEADGPADELARRLGLDSTTVYRRLEALAERGLVKVEKARAKVYRVDEVVKALARMLLQSSAKQ